MFYLFSMKGFLYDLMIPIVKSYLSTGSHTLWILNSVLKKICFWMQNYYAYDLWHELEHKLVTVEIYRHDGHRLKPSFIYVAWYDKNISIFWKDYL